MKYDFIKNYDRFVLLIWIFMFIAFFIQYIASMSVLEAFLLDVCVILSAYPFTTYLSKPLLKKAVQQKNMPKFIVQFFAVSIFYSVIISVILALFGYLENIGIFPQPEYESSLNNPVYDFLNAFLISLIINLSFCGLRFFEQNLRLQNELAESRHQILKAQINPHFMFNVLNHVNVLIRKEPDLASSLLVQYTHILRYQLYNGEKEVVSIKQELEFLKDFIEIEKVRWKNNLEVNCSWEVENENTVLSPLLLITFVENAFKHVSRSKTERGYVHIDLKQKNGELALFVENSKYADIPAAKKKEASGIGLENIKKRLEILYPNRYSLHMSETDTTYSTSLSIKL